MMQIRYNEGLTLAVTLEFDKSTEVERFLELLKTESRPVIAVVGKLPMEWAQWAGIGAKTLAQDQRVVGHYGGQNLCLVIIEKLEDKGIVHFGYLKKFKGELVVDQTLAPVKAYMSLSGQFETADFLSASLAKLYLMTGNETFARLLAGSLI